LGSYASFVEAIRKHQPQVVGMSALLTTTMSEMKNTLKAIEDTGLRKKVRIFVGGAPVMERFAKEK
jgi:5-methyltetrahydrofolate--homocysteine methyltransferase